MIINQTIKNGFTVVNKTGAYFSLISAGGVVNVSLSEKGRTVLDTKMWVGMSIDKAIPFDEITIKGDDGAVEFWAGDVSMNQSRANITGAKAIRTNKLLVNGLVQLTSSDFTRTAVRVRTNKDVFIGGAAVNGSGWRLAAGTMEEFPVAGVLSAYKAPPRLSIKDSQYIGEVNDLFESGSFGDATGRLYISDDEKTMISWKSGRPKIWTDDNPVWRDHPSFVGVSFTDVSLINSPLTDSIFIVRMTGTNGSGSYSICQYTIYESKDKGRTFGQYAYIDANTKLSQTLISNSGGFLKLVIVGNILTICQSGIAISFNIVDKSWSGIAGKSVPSNFLGSVFYNFIYVSNDSKVCIFLSTQDKKLRRSVDGGISWEEIGGRTFGSIVFADAINYFATPDGSTKTNMLSNDGGQNWTTFGEVSGNGDEDYPIYLADGIWLRFDGQYLKTLSIDGDGNALVETALQTHNPSSTAEDKGYLTNSGIYYRLMNADSGGFLKADKWQLDLKGDLSPAVVEVMELLS
ncbi:hypothetical protein RJP56_18865 [Shewanella baltica]|uniref:hypothetical protein n=1 Tax=Shewanella baltica TaxID=62322 RepID=UPI0028722A78|nr:hypothetical protein [Shewanella baltica]MDR9768126.1 hypothetical protein [Shewanella baltica]